MNTNDMFSDSKPKIATNITILIILTLLWLILGHTERIWSSVLFFLSFTVAIIALTNTWVNRLRGQHFDRTLLVTIVIFFFLFVFANAEMAYWGNTTQIWFAILNVIRWIVVAAYAVLLIFTIVRTVQEKF